MKTEVVVRIPPSPTGWLHIGTARTVLFNYLFAKKHNGKIIFRSEDTDKERSKKEYEDDIINGLKWLGFSFDEFYRQSERSEIYKKHIQKLLDENKAYISKEETTEEGQRSEVIRFRNPNKLVTFKDLVRGEITFDTTELKDFVIAKSIDEPLYHLAVVVDDIEMGITHIIRGEDHISNTPRQILITEALGGKVLEYAHIPLILGEDRSKLSKRKHGEAVSVKLYREEGFLPEAMVNFLALLGWNPGGEQEIFSLEDLIEKFSLNNIQKGGAIFNREKLLWLNRAYIKNMPEEKVYEEIKNRVPESYKTNELFPKILPLIKDRISIWKDVEEIIQTREFDFFFETPAYEKNLLICDEKMRKGVSVTNENINNHLEKLIELLKEVNIFQYEKIKESVWDYASKEGRGIVLWAFRVALSGKEKSPDPFLISEIIGKEETIKRLSHAKEL